MTILNIARASRAGAHLLVGLFGPPESGKTMSALMLAAGMVPDPKKRILLDTESGRGRLYADDIPGGYDYAELTRPFTPERYVEALLEIEASGYEVVVVDSISHVWSGEGGVLDQADKNGKQGLQKWLAPKLAYRKLTNRLLGSRMHMILCSRAKQPMIEGTGPDGKKTLTPGPWIEVQDKSLRYELTTVLEMTKRGAYVVRKNPGALDAVFPEGGTVGADMGKRVAAWVAGGEVRDPALDALKSRAEDAAGEGTDAFRAFWKGLGKPERAKLAQLLGNYESIAKAADAEREREAQAKRDAATNLDDPFAATPDHDSQTGEIRDDTPAGHQALTNELMRAFEAAKNEGAIDALLAMPDTGEKLTWLAEKAPALAKGIEGFIDGKRRQFREAA